MDNRNAYTCWIKSGTSVYMPSDNVQVVEKLEAGAYSVFHNIYKDQWILTKLPISTIHNVETAQSEVREVMEIIKQFVSSVDMYREWNFLHKRGVLLHGKPGTGKTTIIAEAISHIASHNGVTFIIKNVEELQHFVKFFNGVYRTIEQDRLCMCIYEDIDNLCAKDEGTLINILDGLGSTEHVLNIGTTNYPENLSVRLTDRPSRFDRKIEIRSMDEESREHFFNAKIKDKEGLDIYKWVKATDKFTIAQMTELIKSVFLCATPFEIAVETIRSMSKKLSSLDYDKEKKKEIGFSAKE